MVMTHRSASTKHVASPSPPNPVSIIARSMPASEKASIAIANVHS